MWFDSDDVRSNNREHCYQDQNNLKSNVDSQQIPSNKMEENFT